jgi:serine/threonine protein kinase
VELHYLLCSAVGVGINPGFLPFDDDDISNLYTKILRGEFDIPSHLSAEAADLLKRTLVTDPERRITFQEMK